MRILRQLVVAGLLVGSCMDAHSQEQEFLFRLPGEQAAVVSPVVRLCGPGGPNAGLQFDIRPATLQAVVLDLLPDLLSGGTPDWGKGAPYDVVCGWSGRGPNPVARSFANNVVADPTIDTATVLYTKSRRVFARARVYTDYWSQNRYTGEDLPPSQAEDVVPGAILHGLGMRFPGLNSAVSGDVMVLYPKQAPELLTGLHRYDMAWTPYSFLENPHAIFEATPCPSPMRPAGVVRSEARFEYRMAMEVATDVAGPYVRLPEEMRQVGTVENFHQVCE